MGLRLNSVGMALGGIVAINPIIKLAWTDPKSKCVANRERKSI
jgi:hypothetical protein